ncbi:hypothetical protein EGT07_23875 [Herbaspirillum sp. HC18]|nr:hypothetical protein EGT07_23875 [Herbaspirillum sp. HC18]
MRTLHGLNESGLVTAPRPGAGARVTNPPPPPTPQSAMRLRASRQARAAPRFLSMGRACPVPALAEHLSSSLMGGL